MDPTLPVDPPVSSTVPVERFYSNTPKTPRSRRPPSAQPKSNSTPISNKAASNHTYTSQVVPHDIHNEKLACEMTMSFVGPMPPKEFITTLINTGRDEDKPIDASPFEKVSGAQSEPEMHQNFVEVMKGFALKKWQFVNSANERDSLRDGLGPDVPIYGPEASSEMSKPDFSQMDAFVEFKEKESADPFEDPKLVDSKPAVGVRPSFERNTIEAKLIRGQLGSYVAALLGSQFRLHVFCVLVCGSFARLMCWDRVGAVVTEKFNYTTEPYLAQFFLEYCSAKSVKRGVDPTVQPLTTKEHKTIKNIDCLNDLQSRNPHHREFRMMLIPDRDDGTEHAFLISYPPRYTYRSPFGRATRPMRAYDTEKEKIVFVKDYWRPNVEDIDKEGDIYRSLEEAQVPYIAPFGVGNDVRNFKTRVQEFRSFAWACDTIEFCGLVLYRMSLEKLGEDLVGFQSTLELVRVMSHAMTAHDVAYFKAKILHRDISVGNILIDEEGDGFLIDWDLCIRIRDGPPSARRSQRTGTWQFISAALLRDPQRIQSIEDDRESAIHVLTWLALRYTKHDELDNLHTYLAPYDEVDKRQSKTIDTGGRSKGNQFFDKLPIFTSDPLNRLLSELRKTFSARYGETFPDNEIQEAKDLVAQAEANPAMNPSIYYRLMPYVYISRMESLVKPNWLVEVFNKHLNSNDWPFYDKAVANGLTSSTDSANKRKQEQVKLEERVSGTGSKRRRA